MKILESEDNLGRVVSCFQFCDDVSVLEKVKKLSSLHILTGKVSESVVLEESLVPNNERVIELLQKKLLILYVSNLFQFLDLLLLHCFDCNCLSIADLLSFEH